MNHIAILPHLILCQGEAKSDKQKSEGMKLHYTLLSHQALMKSSGALVKSGFKYQINITYQISLFSCITHPSHTWSAETFLCLKKQKQKTKKQKKKTHIYFKWFP